MPVATVTGREMAECRGLIAPGERNDGRRKRSTERPAATSGVSTETEGLTTPNRCPRQGKRRVERYGCVHPVMDARAGRQSRLHQDSPVTSRMRPARVTPAKRRGFLFPRPSSRHMS